MFAVKDYKSSERDDYIGDVEKLEKFKHKLSYRQKSTTVSVNKDKNNNETPADGSPSREGSHLVEDDEEDVYDKQEQVETGKVTI